MTTTEEFLAETRNGRSLTVYAATIHEAAVEAGHKLYPGNRNLSVWRTTGDVGLSGWFQSYVPIGHEGGLTSYGSSFHVR